jgi:hypothetical protein
VRARRTARLRRVQLTIEHEQLTIELDAPERACAGHTDKRARVRTIMMRPSHRNVLLPGQTWCRRVTCPHGRVRGQSPTAGARRQPAASCRRRISPPPGPTKEVCMPWPLRRGSAASTSIAADTYQRTSPVNSGTRQANSQEY